MTFYHSSQSGFSLVEVLVSITILLLVIVGPMQILSRSINSTNFATEQVNAWFLAQEGLELAQKGRDDLVLGDFEDKLSSGPGTNPISQFLTNYAECFGANGCGLTIGNGAASLVSVRPCGVINCRLQLTPSSAIDRSSYVHDVSGVNTLTPYTRVIKMERTPAAPARVQEIKVTSTVTWRTGSLISSQKVEAVTYLFNVYDTP